MSIYSSNSSDKELFEGSLKGSDSAFSVLGKRYEPKLRSIFNKSFKSIENKLSYSIDVLFEDYKSMVMGNLLRKPIKDLVFDENGSIGGLIDTIANNLAFDMYTRTENHRSKDSTEVRNRAKEEEKLALSEPKEKQYKKFDFGFYEFDENEIDGLHVSNPERAHLAEDMKLRFLNILSDLELRIVELRALGCTQKEIALDTGLTKEQLRNQLRKIGDTVAKLKNS
ncbi:hypothetical protein P4S67_02845 [Pseudoalteromonas sp. B137]